MILKRPDKTNSRAKGHQIEQAAAYYLQKQGLRLVAQNFSCKLGEIDLIMTQDDMLVFVEVRYRQHQTYGSSVETVGYGKQRKLIKTAQYYLQKHYHHQWPPCRFDILAVSTAKCNQPSWHWITNAFDLQ